MQNFNILSIKLIINKHVEIIEIKENSPLVIVAFAQYKYEEIKKYFLSKTFLKLNRLSASDIIIIEKNYSINNNMIDSWNDLNYSQLNYLNYLKEKISLEKINILFNPFSANKLLNQKIQDIIATYKTIIVANNFQNLNCYHRVYLYDHQLYLYDGFYQDDLLFTIKFASFKDAKKAISTPGNYQMKKVDDLTICYQLDKKDIVEFLKVISSLKIDDIKQEEINLEEYFRKIVI